MIVYTHGRVFKWQDEFNVQSFRCFHLIISPTPCSKIIIRRKKRVPSNGKEKEIYLYPTTKRPLKSVSTLPHQNKWAQGGFWVGRLELDFCFVYCFFLVAKGDKGAIVSLPPRAMNPSNHYQANFFGQSTPI